MAEAKAVLVAGCSSKLLVSKAVAPLTIPVSGCIVDMCSILGYLHAPWMGLYQASEAAADMMSETTRLELQPPGVRVPSLWRVPDSSPYRVKSVEDAVARLTGGDTASKAPRSRCNRH